EVSKKNAGGEETLPARYNVQSILGQEVAPDTLGEQGAIPLLLPRNSLLSLRRVQLRFYPIFARQATSSPSPSSGTQRFGVATVGARRRGRSARGSASQGVVASGTSLYPRLAAFFASDFSNRNWYASSYASWLWRTYSWPYLSMRYTRSASFRAVATTALAPPQRAWMRR